MSQDQRKIRPDTPFSDEEHLGPETRQSDVELTIRKKMDEIISFQTQLNRLQQDTYKQKEELEKRELEVEAQRKALEQEKRRLELREIEIRRSVGGDFDGFRGFQQPPTPVGSFVPLQRTPGLSSRPDSPQPVPRRSIQTPVLDNNEELRRELEDLRRELNMMKRITPFAPHPPSPLPRTSHTSIKLREIVETVPKFDGRNIPVSQFARACRRALESLPYDHSSEVEISLTRLLLSKLSGHAYLVVEHLKVDKVEELIESLKDAFLPLHGLNFYRGQLATEFMKKDEHVLDYYGRMRELTQCILDEETKLSGVLDYKVEKKIEEEGLAAFIQGLPRDYQLPIKFENFKDFNTALKCLLRVDKQIQEEKTRMESPSTKNRVANIRPIHEVRKCSHCKKDGHLVESCWVKLGYPISLKQNQTSPSSPKSSPKKNGTIKKRCIFCKRFGHDIQECRRLQFKLNKENSGNLKEGATKDARRSPPPEPRPNSPSQQPGPSRSVK
ncbi:hypothetical protein M0802_015196 [Mischocyttarus mexicanus]|nr:hypothetical protein M0802_015196 [Mischocyttarus mexicanus]